MDSVIGVDSASMESASRVDWRLFGFVLAVLRPLCDVADITGNLYRLFIPITTCIKVSKNHDINKSFLIIYFFQDSTIGIFVRS